jgi:hypothetical protein
MASSSGAGESWRLAVVVDHGYTPELHALGNYRMDPAPTSVLPRLSESEALDAFAQGPTGGFLREGAHAFARFGLFSGEHAPQAPDGGYGESVPVSLRPAWLVVVSGVESVAHRPRPLNGGGPRPAMVLDSWILAVIFDDTGLPHSIVTQTTENPAIV